MNGLIALMAGFWSLGVVEVFTALLAAGSAVGVMRMRRRTAEPTDPDRERAG